MAAAVQPSKDQWLQIESSVCCPFSTCPPLLIDGLKVTFEARRVTALRYVIFPFVDGVLEHKWAREDCLQRRLLFKPCHMSLYKPAEAAKLRKSFGKSALKKHFPRLEEKLTYYQPYWPSFASLKRHLVANAQRIELAPIAAPEAAPCN